MQEFFPLAKSHRKEHEYGWTVDHRRIKAGEIIIHLKGVRLTTDGSDITLLYHRCEGIDGLHQGLEELRKHLLGLAAAFLYLTGQPIKILPPLYWGLPLKNPPRNSGVLRPLGEDFYSPEGRSESFKRQDKNTNFNRVSIGYV